MTVTPGRPPHLDRRSLLQRAAAAGLLATPAAGLLAACNQEGEGDGGGGAEKTAENPFGVEKGKALSAAFFNGGFGEDYAKYFAAQYKAKWGGEVDLQFSKTILTDYQPGFYSGNVPDVLNNSSPETIPLGPVVKGGQVVELDDLLEAASVDDPNVKVKDTLVAGTYEQGLQDGKFYTLNYAYSIYGHWYNQTLFDAKGWTAPKNWAEFTTLAEAAKKEGIAAYTFQGQYPWYIHNVVNEWIWKVGGKEAIVAIDNLEPNAWKSAAVSAALEKLAEMVAKGWVQPGAGGLSHTVTQQAVVDGNALFIWCGSWLEGEMTKTMGDAKLAVSAPWDLTTSDKAPLGTVHAAPGEGFIVPAKGKNTAGGQEFLRQMLSKEWARKFAELTKSLPVVKGAADGLTVSNALTSASKVAAAAPEVIKWYYEGWYSTLQTEVGNQATELMKGKVTPAQFQAAVQKVADEVAKDDTITKQKRPD